MPFKKLFFEPKSLTVIIFFIAGLVLGALGLYAWFFNGNNLLGFKKLHPANSFYEFISPLVALETIEQKEFSETRPLENKIKKVLAQKEYSGEIFQSSIYFRDIEPGRWIEINGDQKFSPGLLLKIPIMIAYFKEAETAPNVLTKQVVYHRQPGAKINDDLEEGVLYSIEDLIQIMIASEDNDAAVTLFDNIDNNSLNEIYSDLGINFKEDKLNEDYLTTKSYALIFRVLYNATYLNRTMSEKALKLLSQTPVVGIAHGLPNNVKVAHKYRSRIFNKDGKEVAEVHDCGIIYLPEHSYLLCIAGLGAHGSLVDKMIREVSDVIYLDMKEKYKILSQ